MPRLSRRRPPRARRAAPEPGLLVAAGVVRRPFGLRGLVYVHPDPDVADPFPPGRTYDVQGAEGLPASLTVAESVLHGHRRVVRFEGVDDRDGAVALRDAVLVRAARAGDLDDDAFWTADLVGSSVVTDGVEVGTVTAVTDGTAHDYLVIADRSGREVLVPAVAELVAVERGRVIVAPVPGLLDPEQQE